MSHGDRLIVAMSCASIPTTAWLVSLRRTPWAGAWFVGVVMGLLWASLALVWPHVTLLGDAAATGVPLMVIAGLVVAFTEGDAINGVADWRKGIPRDAWRVETTQTDRHDVAVTIVKGRAKRTIGTADPIEDWDAFLDLKVRAEQAAQTYNGLGVSA